MTEGADQWSGESRRRELLLRGERVSDVAREASVAVWLGLCQRADSVMRCRDGSRDSWHNLCGLQKRVCSQWRVAKVEGIGNNDLPVLVGSQYCCQSEQMGSPKGLGC